MTLAPLKPQEHDQAEGILRFMLEKGRASHKQVAWLIGYFRRMRQREKAQDTIRHS